MPATPPSLFVRLLRWSEKYTKTDMVYLAKGGFWLTAEQIVIGLTAFGVSIAFARFVPKSIYGTYRFLLSLFWTLTAFSLTGIPAALNRAVARNEEGAYRQAIPFSLLGSLPMSFIAAGIAAYYLFLGQTILGYGALAISLGGPFFQAGYLFASFLAGKKDFRRASLFGIALSLVPAVTLVTIMPFASTPLSFFIAYLASNIAIAAVLSMIVFRTYRPNRVMSTEFRNLSWHFSAVNILNTLATQVDQLFVFHFLGATDLAIYSIATTFPDQMRSMATNLTSLAFPKFVRRSIGEIRQMLWHRIALITAFAGLGIAIYFFAAPFLFHLFYPAYADSIFYSQLYAFSLVALGSMIPSTVLQAHAAKRELYAFNITSATVHITFMLLGILWYGLIGLIGARILSRVFNLALGTTLLNRPRRAGS